MLECADGVAAAQMLSLLKARPSTSFHFRTVLKRELQASLWKEVLKHAQASEISWFPLERNIDRKNVGVAEARAQNMSTSSPGNKAECRSCRRPTDKPAYGALQSKKSAPPDKTGSQIPVPLQQQEVSQVTNSDSGSAQVRVPEF